MAYIIKRRDALLGGTAAMALALARQANGQDIPKVDATPPKLDIEKGASLKLIRPARFVEPDEVIFRENSAKFAKQFGVEVKVDLVGWEDITQQTAVSANTGAGPDIIIGWAESPHIYADKVLELSDIAEYLGKKYGGWLFLGDKYGKKAKTNNWIGLPMGGSGGPLVYRSSVVKAAGFDKIPSDLPGFLKLCQALKKMNKPAGFALGNAVMDAGITAWYVKFKYDSVRPVTAIRNQKKGQAVVSWLGPNKGYGVVDGSRWMPYQNLTVLTPGFPEYVSGHSTFSSAGAKILQSFTGSDTFNAYVTVEAGSSKFEANTPATDIRFTWPTYTATLDDAGYSRRIGGIHFVSGDAHGRSIGTQIGSYVWAKTQQYIQGTVPG